VKSSGFFPYFRTRGAVYIFCLVLLASSSLWELGAIKQKIEGYFESEHWVFKEFDPVQWNMDTPNNKFELKHLSWPAPGLDTFLSVTLDSKFGNSFMRFNRVHIKYKASKTEAIIFAREEHHWMDSPLLFLVNQDRVKDDNFGVKARGVRFNFWDAGGFYGELLFSKYGTWDGEAYMGRVGRKLNRFLETTLLYLKRDWRGDVTNSFNDVFSGVLKINLPGGIDTMIEGAYSRDYVNVPRENKENYAYEIDFRNIRFSRFWMRISYFDYGKDFRDQLGNKFNMDHDKEFDRRGGYLELNYQVPQISITVTSKNRLWRSSFKDGRFLPKDLFFSWNFMEAYVEFINDMTAKTFIERYYDGKYDWINYFVEVSAENKDMKVKFQYKIKDIGVNRGALTRENSIGQRSIYGIEARLNVVRDLTFYTRFAIGSGINRQWESLFAQFIFRGIKNSELIFEYGHPDHTDGDLVNDGDVADNDSRTIDHRILFKFKFWF